MFSLYLSTTLNRFEFNIPHPKWLPGLFKNSDYSKCWLLSEHKVLEIDMKSDWYDLIHLEIAFTRKEDHPGFLFSMGLFKWHFYFHFYDHRHWNVDEDRWETAEDVEKWEAETQIKDGKL